MDFIDILLLPLRLIWWIACLPFRILLGILYAIWQGLCGLALLIVGLILLPFQILWYLVCLPFRAIGAFFGKVAEQWEDFVDAGAFGKVWIALTSPVRVLWWVLCIAGGILGEIFDALPSEGGYSGGGPTRNSYYEPSHSTYVQHNSTVTPSPPAPYQPYTPSPQRDYQKEWYNNGGGAWQQNIQQQQRRDAGQQG